MQTATKINPKYVRSIGTPVSHRVLPPSKPELLPAFCLIAVLGFQNEEKAVDVSSDSEYAEMYGKATEPGRNYSVELYSIRTTYLQKPEDVWAKEELVRLENDIGHFFSRDPNIATTD